MCVSFALSQKKAILFFFVSLTYFKRIHKQKWRRFNALTLSSVDWSAFFLCGTANFLTLYLNHITRFDWNRSHDIPSETLLTLCENKLTEQAFWRLLCALFLLPKWKCLFSEWKKSIFTTNFTDYNFNDNNCDVFIRWFTFIVLFTQTECRFKFNRIQARKKMFKKYYEISLREAADCFGAVFYFDDSHKTEKRISIVIQRKRDGTQHSGHQYMLRPVLY